MAITLTLILLGLKETDRTAVASMPRAVVWVPFMVAAFSFIVVVFGAALKAAVMEFLEHPDNLTYWCRLLFYPANLMTIMLSLMKGFQD